MTAGAMDPFLARMGFAEDDRVLITHIDDIGFRHASNVASFECVDLGPGSTAARPRRASLQSADLHPYSRSCGPSVGAIR